MADESHEVALQDPEPEPGAAGEELDDQEEKSEPRDRDNPVLDERIDIDFFINVPLTDAAEDKIRQVFAQTCEVKSEQVVDIQIVPQNSSDRTRITLKIKTDTWEMPTLSTKVQDLIPRGILGQSLLTVLELEKRPRVAQFFSKSSVEGAIPRIDQPDKYPYDPEERKRLSRSQGSLSKPKDSDGAQAGEDDTNSPEDRPAGCACIIM